MKSILCVVLVLGLVVVGTLGTPPCTESQEADHPVLCHMLQRAEEDLDSLVRDMHEHAAANGLLVGNDWVDLEIPLAVTKLQRRLGEPQDEPLPVVFAHGIGMQHITQRVSTLLGGVYSTCIATGKSRSEDTKNGYFLNMDASVDVFAAGVAADPKLQNGFHAIGFSQGNNVIRGYIAKYNAPAVHTFISVNGVNAGEGAVPYCRPSTVSSAVAVNEKTTFDMCDFLMEQASKQAYTEFAQENSFQANYWRDPRPSAFADYQQYCQLAKWNNEAGFVNQTLVENWSKTQAFVWVMATEDGMVFPKEGEQWGAPDPNDPFNTILPMKDTEWYKQDLFGLRTADEAGKNFFESFEGDHLQFKIEDFDAWVHTYLSNIA